MFGRFNNMSENLDVKGKSINEIMRWYYDDRIIINRRYQRKLVWTLEENRLFIDSLINKYPTPSIIVSEYQDGEGKEAKNMYEIIDGLQRLNAIINFVNNKYGIIIDGEEYFYDTQFTPSANRKKLDGELIQNERKLDYKICESFSEEPIPVVITEQMENRYEKIEQIFGRINSSGRKLSAHDIRQASCVSNFADCVRRISTIVRGDYTYSDLINICDMPKISLKSKGLDYGIDPNEVFWRKHDIFPLNNFKQSKDEELIASILVVCLLGESYLKVNSEILNNLYTDDNHLSIKVNQRIDEIGKDKIEQYFKDIFNEIDNIFYSVNSTFANHLYSKKEAAGKDISFLILFCALYSLYNQHYVITDYKKIAKILKNHADKTFYSISKDSSLKNKKEVYKIIYMILQDGMEKHLTKQRTDDEKLVEKLLSLSSCESQMIEFKIGTMYFEKREWNEKEIRKISKTLVAMSNTECDYQQEGYVIIGIADNKKSAKNWEKNYSKMAICYGKHYVVGIEAEAMKYFSSVDEYMRNLISKIDCSPITKKVKNYVVNNSRVVNFYGKELLLLPTKYMNDSLYDETRYIRKYSKTEKDI